MDRRPHRLSLSQQHQAQASPHLHPHRQPQHHRYARQTSTRHHTREPPISVPQAGPAASLLPDIGDENFDPHNLNNLVSNDVMEAELATVQQEMGQLKAAGQPVPEELSQREAILGVRMQALVIQVQVGRLTTEAYQVPTTTHRSTSELTFPPRRMSSGRSS
jgi:hypothetical protein